MNKILEKELVCGINAVSQIVHVRPKSVTSLYFHKSQNQRIKILVEKATELEIDIVEKDSAFFEKKFF